MSTTLHQVSASDIQPELNRIWESLETKNTTRASLFNLVFFTDKNHRTPYFQKIAQKVIEKFPSRVIFVILDKETKEPFLKTEVSILTSSKGEFDVACDYIQIQAGGNALERAPFLILPQLLPDLPIYLLWAADPSKSESLCPELEKYANRIIFDSEITDNLALFAQSVLKHYQNAKCNVADLNWARIEDWRDLFSMVFYTQDRLSQIKRSKSIRITYNREETPFFCHTQIQSVYLQAWLSCQLNWKFQSVRAEKNALVFTYETEEHPVEITLVAENDTKLPPGIILSVELLTLNQEKFAFDRSRTQLHQITLQYSDPQSCNLPWQYMFSKAESGHSLVKEICHRGTSEHYVKVLNLISQMENLKRC